MEEKKICKKCKIEKSIENFHFRKWYNSFDPKCKNCKSEQYKKYYEARKSKNPSFMKDEATRIKQRAKTIQLKIYEILQSGKCIDCGNNDVDVLEFDHVRGIKEYGICEMVRRKFALETILKEIDKCEIRCANCHRKKTRKQLKYFSESV